MIEPNRGQARTAVGYARVSTRDQADNGHSLDTQRTKIGAYATLHDLELSEVIVDEGQSAKSLDRPGMGRLLGLIRRRAVNVVVIAKLDRITRSVRDLGELVELFQRSGVEFASVADNIDTSSASGRLVLNVMASVSQWEREAIGERTAEALAHIRAQGGRIGRFIEYGYRLATDGKLEPEPSEQAAIRAMLELRARGIAYAKIDRELEARGYVGRNGQRLSAKVVRDIIRRAGKRHPSTMPA
jgi:DNA invertase Pin-like site-specific DNA recombinase